MPVGANQTIRFGPFELDTQCGQLRKDGVGLKLQGQPIQVLEILLQNPGQLVTREEIRQRLWTSDTFVDFDHSLNTAVKKLRQTLGDEADTPRYIETLPKRGYRFIGDVAREEQREETLALFATAIPVGTVANPSQKRSRLLHWKWVLASCAVTLLAVVGIEAYRSLKPDPLPRITNSHLLVQNTFPVRALLTDGTSIYFQERRPSGLITSQVPVTGGEVSEIPTVNGALSDISRDGSKLLFWVPRDPRWSQVDVWTQPLPAGPARLIVKDSTVPIWNSDGRSIFFFRKANKGTTESYTELYRANADGTDVQWLASFNQPHSPRLSPDGSRIRFIEATDYHAVDVGTDGSNPHVLRMAGHKHVFGGTFSPDGKFYFFNCWDGDRFSLWVVSEERSQGRNSAPVPKQLTFGPMSTGAATLSKDGKQIYVMGVEHRGELSVYDREVGKFVPYLGGISVSYVDFSRDGQWMAYVTYPEGTLWRTRIDGSEKRQLTVPPMAVMNPRWSPDGKLIAFMDLANDDREQMEDVSARRVYVVSAEGGSPMLMLGSEPRLGDPTWSPDGNSIAYGINPDGYGLGGEVRVLDLQTQKSTKVPGSDGMWSPRWSPDGRYLVANKGPIWASSSSAMMLFTFATNTWQELVSGSVGWYCWSRDSKFVYGQEGNALIRVEASNHKKEEIASLSGFRSTAYYLDRWGGGWFGLDPNDRPITTRDTGIQGLYAFDLEYK
jgi:DNA-binding winged helix-turn-helix (wHTH) protein/Tol biopolymer transport system component